MRKGFSEINILNYSKINTLVFEGGSVKGLAYVGALETFDDHRKQQDQHSFLSSIEHVAGTSAGAIMALLVALGLNLEQIRIVMNGTSFKSFEDNVSWYAYGDVGKGAAVYFKGYLCEGDFFMQWVENLLAKYGGSEKLTFEGLYKRTKKDLHVYAVRLNDHAVVSFNAKDTPEMSVALAVRMSMSIPVFFKPVRVDEVYNENDQLINVKLNEASGTYYYVDGGVKANYPYQFIKKTLQLEDSQILGFRVDSNEEIYQTAVKQLGAKEYLQPLLRNQNIITTGYGIGLMPYMLRALMSPQEDAHHREPSEYSRTVYCWDCEVSTFDFDLDDKKIEGLLAAGVAAAQQFIIEHTLPEKQTTFPSLKQQIDLSKSVSPQQITFTQEYKQQEAQRLQSIMEEAKKSVEEDRVLDWPQFRAYLDDLQKYMAKISSVIVIRGEIGKITQRIATQTNVGPEIFEKAVQSLLDLANKKIHHKIVVQSGAKVTSTDTNILTMDFEPSRFFTLLGNTAFLGPAETLLDQCNKEENPQYNTRTIQRLSEELEADIKTFQGNKKKLAEPQYKQVIQAVEDARSNIKQKTKELKQAIQAIDEKQLAAEKETVPTNEVEEAKQTQELSKASRPSSEKSLSAPAPAVDSEIQLKQSQVGLVISKVFTVKNVPPELVEVVRQYQRHLIEKGGVVQTIQLEDAIVDACDIQVANLHSDSLKEITWETLKRKLNLPETEATSEEKGKLNWDFSGNNQLKHVVIRIRDRCWEVQFSRSSRLIDTYAPTERTLKTTAHQSIYRQMVKALLTPMRVSSSKKQATQVVILQGAPGLGKTHCARHCFYHYAQEPAYDNQHQTIAWLSGTSEAAFKRDWSNLANEFRQIQSLDDSIVNDDTAVIRDWCESKLGRWLFIVDEANVDPVWLAKYLPQQGGHVIVTTHQPNYKLSESPTVLTFETLSPEDSKQLLQAYSGEYWQATGHEAEESALEYMSIALGGYPSALVQMALLVRKKCISWKRLMVQFQQPTVRSWLLGDTVFQQLQGSTFSNVCEKGLSHFLAYLGQRYHPSLNHQDQIKKFVEYLQEQMGQQQGEIPHYYISGDNVRAYWQWILASVGIFYFDAEVFKVWLSCLPISYDSKQDQWQLALAGLSVLKNQVYLKGTKQQPIDLEKFSKKVFDGPSISSGVNLSFNLTDSTLEQVKIDILTMGESNEFKAWQLPVTNPYFIPRPKLTKELAEKLPPKKAGEPSAQLLLTALTGMGGIGKTELARHFITDLNLSSHYARRFWFSAETEWQLRNEFQRLAAYLGLVDSEKYTEDKQLISYVHKWLSIHSGWLMVLDNADNYNAIVDWVPKEGGSVLVTSREQKPGKLNTDQIVKVKLLEAPEAVQWLYQLSGRDRATDTESEERAAKNLVEKLGCLPLAIAQAAAYLRAQPTVTISDYHQRFKALLSDPTLKEEVQVGEEKEMNSNESARLVVASTWKLSLDAIEEYAKSRGVVSGAQLLLKSCAYLASKDIPVPLLEHFLGQIYKFTPNTVNYVLDEEVGQLLRYSLMERNSITDGLSVHRLVQEVMRMDAAKAKEKYLNQICNTLIGEEIEKTSSDMSSLLYKRRLIPHMEMGLQYYQESLSKTSDINSQCKEETRVELSLLEGLSYCFSNVLSDQRRVKEYLLTALPLVDTCYGNNSVRQAQTLTNLGHACLELGEWEEAEKHLQKARDKVHSSLLLAKILNGLGCVYDGLGKEEEAETDFKCALKIYEKHNATSEPGYGSILNSLAGHYYRLAQHYYYYDDDDELHGEKLGEAKDNFEKALENYENYYGREHVKVALVLSNLGCLCMSLHNYTKAFEHLNRSLTINEGFYGKKHLRTAMVDGNLGINYLYIAYILEEKKLDNAEEAKKRLLPAYNIIKANYGDKHEKTLFLMGYIKRLNGLLKNLKTSQSPIGALEYGSCHASSHVGFGVLSSEFEGDVQASEYLGGVENIQSDNADKNKFEASGGSTVTPEETVTQNSMDGGVHADPLGAPTVFFFPTETSVATKDPQLDKLVIPASAKELSTLLAEKQGIPLLPPGQFLPEGWTCYLLNRQLQCQDPTDPGVIRTVSRFLYAPPWTELPGDTYHQCDVSVNGRLHRLHCVGNYTEFVELRIVSPPSLWNAMGQAALWGAGMAVVPEAIGDMVQLAGYVNAEQRMWLVYLLNLVLVVVTGSYVPAVVNSLIHLMMQGVGFSESTSRLTANAATYITVLGQQLTPSHLAMSAACYLGGRVGLWAEKRVVDAARSMIERNDDEKMTYQYLK